MIVNKIYERVSKTAAENKSKIAFHYFNLTWKEVTYEELLIKSKGIASNLIKEGIKKGDSIAIISENRPEWCISYLAISLSGGIAVPVDSQLSPAEIKNLLNDSKSKYVFYSAVTEKNVNKAIKESDIKFIDFDSPEFENACNTPDFKHYPDVSEEDVASIIYTSGTTGIPKGVQLTHKNFCSDAEALVMTKLMIHSDNVLSILPFHHTYPFMGTFLLPVFLGATVTFAPSLKGPEIMSTIKDKEVTIVVGVPQLLELIRNGILNRINKLPGLLSKIMIGILKLCGGIRQKTGINPGKFIFKSVHEALGRRFRFFACGGAKLDPQVMKDLEALGLTVLEGYGLTETSPVVTFNSLTKRKPGSAGMPLPSVDIKIMDTETHEGLGVMKEGEITIKGPMVTKGYYKNPQATEQAIRNGRFFSGDIGFMDKENYLFITGRLKEVIVLSSGKNVYPEEVEKQYLKIPLIKEICVMGADGDGIAESVNAVIVPDFEYAKKTQTGNIQEALKWEINNVSIRLPQYMRIKGYTLSREPLPRTPLGKLRRFMVKELLKVKSEKSKVRREEDKDLVHDEVGMKVVGCIEPLLKEKVPVQSTDNLELDLGLDSLARIELVVSLEKAFSMKLPDTFASEIQTVSELVAKIGEYGTSEMKAVDEKPGWKDILATEPGIADRKKAGLRHSFLEWLIIIICLQLIKFIAKIFFRLKVEGLENLPEKGPYIITPNHASYLDAFSVVASLPAKSFRDLYTIGVQEYFTGTLKDSFTRLAHVIPIDPETYLIRALQMASFILRNGKSLLIFPEGGRSYNGEIMEFKKGAGILSIELGIPVIPVYIKGSYEAFPRGTIVPKFTEIKIIIGKSVYPSDVDMSEKPEGMDNYQFFVNELRERVRKLRK
ncbi:MAG: hypothetical protein A2Y97_09385 [Nitrospirae bacterium RBG_13_39_12]|nr:MAG: hypothetical protein A2Y97_09385 [Nitrospirae bacterium RBG_13_39_12]